MSPALRNILRSLALTSAISLGLGIAVFLFTLSIKTFFSIFIATFVLQFIIHYFWQSWVIRKAMESEDELYKMYLAQGLKQSVNLVCAYCRQSNTVNINVNDENIFACKGCNQRNIVMMEFSTAQVTIPQEPVDVLNKIAAAGENVSVKVNDLATPIEFKS